MNVDEIISLAIQLDDGDLEELIEAARTELDERDSAAVPLAPRRRKPGK